MAKKREIKEVNINGSRVFVEKGQVKTVLSEEIQKAGFMSVEEAEQITLAGIMMIYELNEE